MLELSKEELKRLEEVICHDELSQHRRVESTK